MDSLVEKIFTKFIKPIFHRASEGGQNPPPLKDNLNYFFFTNSMCTGVLQPLDYHVRNPKYTIIGKINVHYFLVHKLCHALRGGSRKKVILHDRWGAKDYTMNNPVREGWGVNSACISYMTKKIKHHWYLAKINIWLTPPQS